MWAVFIGLGLLFVIVSRSSLADLLRLYYAQDNFQRGMQVQLIDRVYFLVSAFILLILMIVVEEYFKNGARKNKLAQRIARVFGFEIFFIFLANVTTAYLMGFSSLVILALILEFLISCGLLWFGYKISPGTIQNKI